MPFTPARPAAPPAPAAAPAAPVSVRAPAAAPAAAPAEVAEESISVPLSAISGAWPPAVREEILSLQEAAVSLPVNRLDAAMKTGRVSFSWADLSQWITPSAPEPLAQNRETLVEVPLNVIAPLYMARHRPSVSQKKVVIPESIPGVFSGAPPPAATEETPAAAPAEVAAEAPAVRSPTLGELLGQPGKTDWPPQHVTQHLCLVEGVAGTLLATSDGLPVSGQMPAHVNCETLSAFVPQMFSRMSQSAAEMRLGLVTSVVVTAGQAPYAILRAGKLYLVVLGQAGQRLPESVLQQIAAELAKTNQ
jgi:predicted regulator of Ras-like GTPase activity (Roadblock/LC7/MglB family)